MKNQVIGQLSPGTNVAGYEIQSSLGRGGMGDVYLARRDGETRSVALKLLSVSLASETRFRDRFERESHLATSLEHPHIVPVYATGDVEGVRYIAMRYVDGPTLRELIDAESPLGMRRVCSLLDQIASALDDAHGIGLVHRDIKPGNILISRSGASEFREHAYLTDFGVSKYTGSESDFTRTGQFVGTTLYAAPEQIKGEKVDGRTDVYAFGCVLFECLTGRVPFERESEAALLWAQMIDDPVPVTALRPDLPSALDAVVAKAMAKEPDERYQTCGAVVAATRAAIEAEQSRASTPAPVAATVLRVVEETDTVAPVGATVMTPAEDTAPPSATADVSQTEAPPLAAVADLAREPATATAAAVEAPAIEAAPDAADGDSHVTADTASESSPALPVSGALAETVIAAPLEPEAAPGDTTPPAFVTHPERVAETVTAETLVTASSTDSGLGAATIAEGPGAYQQADTRTSASERSRRPVVVAAIAAVVLLGAAVVAVLALRDGGGNVATLLPPASTSPPEIGGTAQVRSLLTASRGAWRRSPTSFAFQWRRCNGSGSSCSAVAGETSRVYRLRARDEGRRMRVAVTASNADGKKTSVSRPTAAVAPALEVPASAAPPTLSGTTQEGSTLSVSEGRWRGTEPLSVTYEWQRCNANGTDCATIAGATGRTYALPSRDVGYTIRVVERASNKAGKAAARTTPTAVITAQPVPPDPTDTTDTTDTVRPPHASPPLLPRPSP